MTRSAGLQLAAAASMDDFDFEKSHVIACESHDLLPPLAAMECMLAVMIDRSHVGWMGIGPKIFGGLYSEDDKQFLVTLKNSLVVALTKCQILRRNQAAECGSGRQEDPA